MRNDKVVTTGAKSARAPRRRRDLTPYLLVIPAALYLAVFLGYPIARGVYLSFTDTGLLAPNRNEWVGVDNYASVLTDDSTWHALGVTLAYAAGSVLGALGLGLMAALVMNSQTRGRALIRSIVAIPWAVPPIAVALIFSWMYNNQYGVVNFLAKSVGLIDQYQAWLDSSELALPTVTMITVWMTFPITALVLLAALQSVPAELYEAAKMDGAGVWTRFNAVTVPGIRPTLYVMILLLTIWAIRRFDLIWVLTQGGPVGSTSTVVVELFREAFKGRDLGTAATLGVIGLAVSTVITCVYFVVARREEQKGA